MVTPDETVETVTDGDVVLIVASLQMTRLTEPNVVEAVLELAAVVDVLDDVGRGGWEGVGVAGGPQVDPRDAGREVNVVPIMVISLPGPVHR